MARVPDELPVPGAGLVLRRWRASDVDAVVAAVDRSFTELRRWMPWAAAPATRESVGAFLERAGAEAGSDVDMDSGGSSRTASWWAASACTPAGALGPLEIGYWVRTDRTGRGYATAAARVLTAAAFDYFPEVDRVEIRCDPANAASAAIPPKLGYRLDGEAPAPIVAADQTGRQHVWALSRPLPRDVAVEIRA